MQELHDLITNAWNKRDLLREDKTINAIREVISLLDEGKIRVAEPTSNGWQVNEWVKKAVVLYFPIQKMEKLAQNKNLSLSEMNLEEMDLLWEEAKKI